MSNSRTDSDLEPLIVSQESPAAKNSKWRFNRKNKLFGFKRREPKSHQEKWGRFRLGAILCAFAFLLIYLSNLKPYQHLMVVKIPEDDVSLPGPKGKLQFLSFILQIDSTSQFLFSALINGKIIRKCF